MEGILCEWDGPLLTGPTSNPYRTTQHWHAHLTQQNSGPSFRGPGRWTGAFDNFEPTEGAAIGAWVKKKNTV
eukprot:3934772-Rhodomonas_salina.1